MKIRSVSTSILLSLALAACGGGGGSPSSGATGPGSSNPAPGGTTISGVAATGAAIQQGTVTLEDKTGTVIATATIDHITGNYTFTNVTASGPFILEANGKDTNGNTISLHAMASQTGTININPLTDLVVLAAAKAKANPAISSAKEVFAHPASYSGISTQDLQNAAQQLVQSMSANFRNQLQVNGATNVDPITSPYTIGQGLDRVLDNVGIQENPDGTVVEVDKLNNNTQTTIPVANAVLPFAQQAGYYSGTVATGTGYQGETISVYLSADGTLVYNSHPEVGKLKVAGSNGQITGSGTGFQTTAAARNLTGTFSTAAGPLLLDLTVSDGNKQPLFTVQLIRAVKGTGVYSAAMLAGTISSDAAVYSGTILPDGTITIIETANPVNKWTGTIGVADPATGIYTLSLQDAQGAHWSGLGSFIRSTGLNGQGALSVTLIPDDAKGQVLTIGFTTSGGVISVSNLAGGFHSLDQSVAVTVDASGNVSGTMATANGAKVLSGTITASDASTTSNFALTVDGVAYTGKAYALQSLSAGGGYTGFLGDLYSATNDRLMLQLYRN